MKMLKFRQLAKSECPISDTCPPEIGHSDIFLIIPDTLIYPFSDKEVRKHIFVLNSNRL